MKHCCRKGHQKMVKARCYKVNAIKMKVCRRLACLNQMASRHFRARQSKLFLAVLACLVALSVCVYHLYQGTFCRVELAYITTDYNDIDLKVQAKEESGLGNPGRNKMAQDSDILAGDPATSNPRARTPEVDCRVIDVKKNLLDNKLSDVPLQNTGCRLCLRRSPYLNTNLLQPDTLRMTFEELIAKYPDMEKGGRLRPANCLPLQKVAIIIPFRKRHDHLSVLLNNLIPFCARQNADVTFFIIEQESSSVFNRGALMNIGFLEAEKMGNFDCFIFHDVDLIPLNDANLYRCGENPRHFAVALNKYGYRLPYESYFGGVIGFSRQQYLDINGNSNLYFGWGGEDDDLLLRCVNKGYYVTRYTLLAARYDMIRHELDKGNEVNPNRILLLKSASLRQDTEGLSTTKYKVIHKELKHLYTWITVSLNMTEVLKSIPDYVLQAMNSSSGHLTRGHGTSLILLGVSAFVLHYNNGSSLGFFLWAFTCCVAHVHRC